ncbi:hypothetical protein GE21DRAFT_5341 [Neurospora crassa]|uniref:Uncharacterized protein n=1 Tax=Neurospora crassa (strain ATCC 24698 / 74-OR23-1A / CBS 708.71 / DSM 1257 / FGSC 987) TaxID=367110 RepID=Q7S1E2_NEUCR|nr:hypothetical protein NCU04893 [Neurospora crassa OR74A]EAA29166.3 hypothetical protein NCU04893 [Neurospora crassa OR74A]KHE78848.1 hypothetical protein GE21DRAFT_5341 [Neurospora crassa]|eukprot:XP_958402.3 hypothetical protein NCU04893 [Neurospora crassa OR74A]
MEETVFQLGGLDLTAAGSDVTIWDLQLWSVFQIRFHKTQSKGEDILASLGFLGESFNLGTQRHKRLCGAVACPSEGFTYEGGGVDYLRQNAICMPGHGKWK